MIEEAPAAVLPDDIRVRLRTAAVDLLSSIDYRNAGTVEFLYDENRREFSFMEVNARIQVEHPVSEEITGRDLIKLQLEVGIGLRALPTQQSIKIRGHAIEVRILAEDPSRNFSPSPGRITRWQPPVGPGIRVDSGVSDGSFVPPFYDSMIAKLIVRGSSRDEAIGVLAGALARFEVGGITTNIPLLQAIVAHEDFRNNHISTRWLETTLLPSFSA
jgi:acetyl-CoA carboxylase biotin carboxylase subunit